MCGCVGGWVCVCGEAVTAGFSVHSVTQQPLKSFLNYFLWALGYLFVILATPVM